MGSAYTPGLKVSAHTVIEKTRRLPLKGEVLVKVGDTVTPDTIVARTELPGTMQSVKLAEQLGVEPAEIRSYLKVQQGDRVDTTTVLAQTKGLFGLFKTEIRAPVAGTLELIVEQTGHLGIRLPPTPIEKDAYIHGRVHSVIPTEGVVVQCVGALVQGIFGVGGERQGDVAVASPDPTLTLTEEQITPAHQGKILVGGAGVTLGALRRAVGVGVAGLVVGGIVDRELIEFMREQLRDPTYDIGVAITGHEPIPITLVVTEGFGAIQMAQRTFELLSSLSGRRASINGATQIRAGVIRPEIIATLDDGMQPAPSDSEAGALTPGTPIRVIREPYFGLLGAVCELPSELQQVESETWVRVLTADLADGRRVTVPRANVEIIEIT